VRVIDCLGSHTFEALYFLSPKKSEFYLRLVSVLKFILFWNIGADILQFYDRNFSANIKILVNLILGFVCIRPLQLFLDV
jgi:hypothetical protein